MAKTSNSPETARTSVPYGAPITKDDVERMIRNVIVERGFGCTLLAVSEASTGWDVTVRAGTGALLRFSLSSRRAIAARAAIEEALEAGL
ncbi:MAG: hypothetical protein ABI868_05245 [Acidobacteriota bacterium]